MLSAQSVDAYFAAQGERELPAVTSRKTIIRTRIERTSEEWVVRAYGKHGRIVSADYFSGGLCAESLADCRATALVMTSTNN